MKKKVSKILLINTPRLTLKQLNEYSERSKYYWEVYPPLGFMYISAAVKNEIDYSEIKVLDLHIESIKKSQKNQKVDWLEMTEDCMKSFQPDMVAISVMFGASFESAQLVGKFLRKKYPDLVIASGGVHVTGIVKEKNNGLEFNDFVIIKESEKHFPQLVKYLNEETNLVNGVIPIKTNKVRKDEHFTKDTDTIEHVDELPIPDYGIVDIKNYYKHGILSAAQTVAYDTPLATMQTVRGCTARCTFCSVRNFNGFGVRTHSPERVLKEIEILYNKFGIRHIDFVDDDFTVSRSRVVEICKMLIEKKYNLTWSIGNGIRLGTLDDELLTYMADSGCTYFSLGIESGDDKMLKEMKKPLTLKILNQKAPLLEKHTRIYYRANFITGYPDETPEQLNRTFECAKNFSWDWCLFSLCKPLPDTELYNKLLENKFEDTKFSGGKKKNEAYNFQEHAGIVADEERKIFELTYDKNLEINFKLNKNLQGRHIKRAISDFERVTKLSENHAFAWNCLALGYEKMQLQEKVKFAKNKTKEIVNNSNYWKNKFEQLEFKPIY
tara:strand:+ start:1673 stop:3328 length:1656 start_codon:yes stop_codon:yes gene_type:complete